MANIYETDLPQNPANYEALSPLSYLKRSATLYPEYPAIVHGDLVQNWGETYQRCIKFASALSKAGIGKGDTVAVMLPNIPEMFELHFSVAMTGAVLNAINTRLDDKTVAFILDHGEAKVFITDAEFSSVTASALDIANSPPLVLDVEDPLFTEGEQVGSMTFSEMLATGDEIFDWSLPDDEWDAISLNYTSGTTGNPKGVVYHHRGAYLNAANNALTWDMGLHPRYLWTLPMFHCNGWCFPWTMSAIIGTHVCLRQVRAESIWQNIKTHKVSHLCGAPIVMSVILSLENQQDYKPDHQVQFFTAAAPPPESVLKQMQQVGFLVTHLYGLTETYGPAVINEWHQGWDDLEMTAQASLKARQGVRYLPLEHLSVLDPETMIPVPADGKTIGEVMFQGNIVMKGYLKNKIANDKAFAGGWFHSGDLAVMHPDGYLQLKDRSKDIIISGGENISSIEIEEALLKNECVAAAAVIAVANEKWGEVPCAFIELKPQHQWRDDQANQWCRENLASFKVPKYYFFEDIPRTSTGKIQKYVLREKAKKLV